MYDIIGFGCLTLYESFMFFVPVVRQAYGYVHDGKEPEVEINDGIYIAVIWLYNFGANGFCSLFCAYPISYS